MLKYLKKFPSKQKKEFLIFHQQKNANILPAK